MANKVWKRTAMSATVLALAGAGLIGASEASMGDFGVDVDSFEAATTAPSASILALDQYVIAGTEYNPLANVQAFGTQDGQLINLTEGVQVVESNVDPYTPGEYNVTYQVTSPAGDVVEKQVLVTVGLDPTQGLHIYETSLLDLEQTIANVGLKDEDQQVLQDQIDRMRETIGNVQGDLENLETGIEERDQSLPPVREHLLSLQGNLDTLHSYAVELYTAVNDLDEALEIHKALADTELARVENDLNYTTSLYENTIAELEEAINASGDAERVSTLQEQVDATVSRFEALISNAQNRVNEVSAEVIELGRLEGQSEGRDAILQDLIDTNETEIQTLEDQIEDASAARDAEIQALDAEINDKMNQLEIHTIQEAIDNVNAYYDERTSSLEDRLAELKASTEALTSENAVFDARLSQMQEALASLRDQENYISNRVHEQLIGEDELKDTVEEALDIDNDKVSEDIVEDIVNNDDVSQGDESEENAENGEELTPDEEPSEETSEDAGEDEPAPEPDSTNEEDVTDTEENGEDSVEEDAEPSPEEDAETPSEPVEEDVADSTEGTDNSSENSEDDANNTSETDTSDGEEDTYNPDDLGEEVVVGEDLGDEYSVVEDGLYDDLEFEPFSTFSTVPQPQTDSATVVPNVASIFSFTPSAEESTDTVEAAEDTGPANVQTFEANEDAAATEEAPAEPTYDVIEHEGYVEYVDDSGTVVGYERTDGEEATEEAEATPAEETESADATEDNSETEAPADQSDTSGEELEPSENTAGGVTNPETPTSGDAVAEEQGGEGSTEATTEEGTLPQTGATYGAIGAAGVSIFAGLGAFLFKKFRK